MNYDDIDDFAPDCPCHDLAHSKPGEGHIDLLLQQIEYEGAVLSMNYVRAMRSNMSDENLDRFADACNRLNQAEDRKYC